MKYLRKFKTVEEYNSFVAVAKEGFKAIVSTTDNTIEFVGSEDEPEVDYSKVAMFFENVDDKAVIIGVKKYTIDEEEGPDASYAYTATLQVSTDGTSWEDWGSTSKTALTKTLQNKGDKLYVRASDNVGYFNTNMEAINAFTSNGEVNVGGNIMSLGYKDFEDKTSISQEYAYNYVFHNMANLVDASKLVLSATTLASNCYQEMFSYCTSLIAAPELPATILADGCYSGMFHGCESLTAAPKLPATELAWGCYYGMFRYCESLTTAPVLPATTLVNSCYSSMFHGCTSLTAAPELPATELAMSCYEEMFHGCTSLTAAPALPATELADYCYQYMFYGCESLTSAPVLPATILDDGCYAYMFQGCESLTTAPELPATTLVNACYNGMFSGCSSLNYIKAMFITSPSTSRTYYWVLGVASTGTFVKNPDATWDVTGVNGVPSGWTVETATAE